MILHAVAWIQFMLSIDQRTNNQRKWQQTAVRGTVQFMRSERGLTGEQFTDDRETHNLRGRKRRRISKGSSLNRLLLGNRSAQLAATLPRVLARLCSAIWFGGCAVVF